MMWLIIGRDRPVPSPIQLSALLLIVQRQRKQVFAQDGLRENSLCLLQEVDGRLQTVAEMREQQLPGPCLCRQRRRFR